VHPDSACLELILGDAESHAFERSFDALFSRFGVMFFENPERAFSHLRAALKPSGRLAFVCWQALEHNPWAYVPLEAVRAVAPELPLPELLHKGLPGPFALGEELELQQLLSEAGFQHVEITAFERPVSLGSSADAAADYCMRMGPAARLVAEADPSLAPAFHAALRQAFQPYTSAKGTWLDAATFVVSARS
jgi:SAM-dependent methyltransferase